MNKKRFFLIIAAIVAICAIVVLFLLFVKKEPVSVQNPQGVTFWDYIFQGGSSSTSSPSEYPGTSEEGGEQDENEDYGASLVKLSSVTDIPVRAYWLASKTSVFLSTTTAYDSVVFYVDNEGNIFDVSNSQTPYQQLPDGKELSYIRATKDGSRILVTCTDGSVLLFDAYRKTWESLGNNIVSAAFSPDGDSIAYLKKGTFSSELFVWDTTSIQKSVSKIASLFVYDVRLTWPTKDKIFLIPQISGKYPAQVWFFDIQAKRLEKLASGNGLGIVFSGTGDTYLEFTSASAKDGVVNLVDIKTKEQTRVFISTFADKCTTDGHENHFYCAIPVGYSSSNGTFPDDYYMGRITTQDAFYKIQENTRSDLLFGSKDVILDARSIAYMNKQLFFVNAYDEKLYMLDLRAYE